MLIALGLRLVHLGDQSLWLDEATSVQVARNFSYQEILTKFSPGDFHPPLYYLVLKTWISTFGSGEVATRMLSVLFGSATVAVLFLIASRLFSLRIGIVAALLLATAPLHIYYSQEARMYSMETFLATMLIWCFVARKWILLTITGALLAYTDYLPALVFLSLLLAALGKKELKPLILSLGAIGLLLLPWVPTFLRQLEVGSLAKQNTPLWWQSLGKTNLKQLALVPVKFLIGRISFIDKSIYAAFVGGYAVVFAPSILLTLKNLSKAKLVWLWLVVPILGSVLMGTFLSGFSYFRLIFVLPAFYLLVALGLNAIKNAKLRTGFIITTVALNTFASCIYLLNPRFHRESWKDAVAWVEQGSSNDNAASIFVTNNQRDPYFYYSKSVPAYGPDGLDRGEFERIYLFRYVQPIFDPQDNLRKKVEALGYKKQEERDFNGVTVWSYAK